MNYENLDTYSLQVAVDDARARYIRAHDARQPSTKLWNRYAQLLHTLRLRKRKEA